MCVYSNYSIDDYPAVLLLVEVSLLLIEVVALLGWVRSVHYQVNITGVSLVANSDEAISQGRRGGAVQCSHVIQGTLFTLLLCLY